MTAVSISNASGWPDVAIYRLTIVPPRYLLNPQRDFKGGRAVAQSQNDEGGTLQLADPEGIRRLERGSERTIERGAMEHPLMRKRLLLELVGMSGDDGGFDLTGVAGLGGGEPRSGQYTGTKALMLAVLEDGIASYMSSVQRVRGEAESWVCASNRKSPFSFNVVCETLGLDPGAVRAALARLRQRSETGERRFRRSRPNVRRSSTRLRAVG